MSDSPSVCDNLKVTTFSVTFPCCFNKGKNGVSLFMEIAGYANPKIPSIFATANWRVSEVISEKVMPVAVRSPTVTSSIESLPLTEPEP